MERATIKSEYYLFVNWRVRGGWVQFSRTVLGPQAAPAPNALRATEGESVARYWLSIRPAMPMGAHESCQIPAKRLNLGSQSHPMATRTQINFINCSKFPKQPPAAGYMINEFSIVSRRADVGGKSHKLHSLSKRKAFGPTSAGKLGQCRWPNCVNIYTCAYLPRYRIENVQVQALALWAKCSV